MEKSVILIKIEENFQKLSPDYQYIREAVNLLEKVLKENYQTTFISFNGGKDATIVLVLTYLALKNLSRDEMFAQKHKINSGTKMLQGIYFQQPNPFKEMQSFFDKMVAVFGLKMHKLETKNYPKELTCFNNKHHMSGVIMGSRHDDPHCQNLDLITESDTKKGYPQFNRINPIIWWSYEQVWKAIKVLEIPYCSLYEQGYSSIGNKDNTVKNPSLLCDGDKRCLQPSKADPQTERICRINDAK